MGCVVLRIAYRMGIHHDRIMPGFVQEAQMVDKDTTGPVEEESVGVGKDYFLGQGRWLCSRGVLRL